MATALITGGSGFIGASLTRLLLEQGLHVKVLSLAHDPNTNLQGLPVEIVRGDIRDIHTLRACLAGCHYLFHLAGTPQLWVPSRRMYYDINVRGTRNVLQAAREVQVARVVYTSTESIIGPCRNGRPCTERTPSKLSQMVGPYCRSKLLAEREAQRAARQGVPVVIVNPTLPVGPGDIHLTPPGKMIVDFLRSKIRAYIRCGLNLVDVRDVAYGHWLAALHGRVGERYILAGENLTLQQLLQQLAEISGLPAPRHCVPWIVALLYSYLAEFIADHFTHRAPVSNVTGVRLARHFMYFDSSRAIRELGFQQRPIRKALEDAVAWFQDKGYLS